MSYDKGERSEIGGWGNIRNAKAVPVVIPAFCRAPAKATVPCSHSCRGRESSGTSTRMAASGSKAAPTANCSEYMVTRDVARIPTVNHTTTSSNNSRNDKPRASRPPGFAVTEDWVGAGVSASVCLALDATGVAMPAAKARVRAPRSLSPAAWKPRNPVVIIALSSPADCAAVRNATTARGDTPLSMRLSAMGSVPHEQRGTATPSSAATAGKPCWR